MTRTARLAIAGLSTLVVVLLATAASQAPSGFVMHEQPRPLPELAFADQAGVPLRLTDFGGRVVLLNLWATWCAPCRREMPTLDSLQTRLGGPDFEVVALSLDREGSSVVEGFYQDLGLEALAIYIDDSAEASEAIGVFGLPTTLLVSRNGEEIGRLIGPAEWDSPAMVGFLRRLLGTSSSPPPTISASIE